MLDKNILKILANLVSFRSISPYSAGSIEYVNSELSSMGFNCDIQTFGDVDDITTNLYAHYGNASPNICFAGHLDVVPIIDDKLWKYDPFDMTISDDIVYGRGVVDMKGAVAAYIAAVKKFLHNYHNFNGTISFLLTSDEEGEAKYGTKSMLDYLYNGQSQHPKIDFCILGEPTSNNVVCDTVKIGRRGSINFTLTVIGEEGHVAYPHEAKNPITTMVKILDSLLKIRFFDDSKFFDSSNLEITSLDCGNTATNVIPKSVSAKFNIRFSSEYDDKKLINLVQNVIEINTKNYSLESSCSSNSFIQSYSDNMKKFVKIIYDQLSIDPVIATNGGTSDARFIYKYAEVLECGLSYKMAHKINEQVKIIDLHKLCNVYYYCLKRFLIV